MSLLAIALATLGGRANATDLRSVITDVTITSWNEKDGLPPALIGALAQDADGYLWVGTRQGLLRFDGVRFSPWNTFNAAQLPDVWIRSLLAAKDGALWIGFGSEGTIARIRDGVVTAFSGTDGLGRGGVLGLAEDAGGTVWAGGENGLHAFDGHRWKRWGQSRGVPEGTVYSAFVAKSGSLHVAVGSRVLVRHRGAERFEPVADFGDTYGSFAETTDGTVWFTDPTTGYRALGRTDVENVPDREGRGVRMVADRKGNLWVGTGGQGLWRTKAPFSAAPSLERSTSLTGLLGDGVYSLLEDRDGNIWAGTTEGLNRVTPRTIEQIVDLGLVREVAMGEDGGLWVRTVDRLFLYPPSPTQPRREFRMPVDARDMALDASGLWVAARGGRLVRVDRTGRAERVRWPSESKAGEIESVTSDHEGGLWLVTTALGIVHWRGKDTRSVQLPDGVRAARVTAAFVDSKHRAWFAFGNRNLVIIHDGGEPALLPAQESPPVYRVIHEDEQGRIWLGGDGGLSRYENGQIATLQTSAGFAVQSITAIVTDNRGAAWLGSPTGVIHLAHGEFDTAVATEGIPRYTVYTRSDGIAGTPVAVGFGQGGLRALDGRLWFVTTRGITVLDPHVLESRNMSMPVQFEWVMADDGRFAAGASVRLPAGTRRVEVDYTVVNLTSPLKTRFRYRLDPFDRDWVDAGARRQAFYTNLRPGPYVFRVAAVDAAGGFLAGEAAWRISVAPMFYETTTFAVLTALAISLMVFAGWRFRERQLRTQFSLLIAERARLGREIHDTLLQGLVAIALQFDSLAHDLSPTPTLQGRFLRLRDRIEEYIREARRSIWDLHTQPGHRNLVESLRRAGEFATDGSEIAFSFQVQGTPYPCPPRVEEQVVRIAQEAALNSVRHANPRRLRIDLAYDESSVTLIVADDGRGFVQDEARGACHFGIVSMQERANSVGGALRLVTSPGHGTEVTAVLPGR